MMLKTIAIVTAAILAHLGAALACGPPTLPACISASTCAQFPLTDAQAKIYTDQYFAGQPFSQETQTQNTAHSTIVPNSTQLAAVTASNLQNSDGQRLMRLVTGNCYKGGTTQQIITCAAIKWGYPPRMFWAEAFNESAWSHSSIGDIGNGVSLGIIQNKSTSFPGTCPGVTGCPAHNYGTDTDANNYVQCPGLNATSGGNLTCLTYQYTTYGMEFGVAWQHACMVGDNTYLSGGQGGTDSRGVVFPPYVVGPGAFNDKWGCMGVWYSGQWAFGSGTVEGNFNGGQGYHVHIQNYYCCQPYLGSGFSNGNGGSLSGCTGTCTLP